METTKSRAAMPHCDQRVLHAPGDCQYCDEYPDWQAAREAWGINFTGKREEGKLPCPSEGARSLETTERWAGNRPAPVAQPPIEKLAPAQATQGLVDDPAKLDTTLLPNGQQRTYLVLSEAERAKGFVRPVRTSYYHAGIPGPRHPLRDLTDEERERYADEGYVKYEPYPEGESSIVGTFWTQERLDRAGKGCGSRTTMGLALAETYARQPTFYSGTFCAKCGAHFPVGASGEFAWEDGSRVGT